MEAGTVKELKDLEQMIINWSIFYVKQVDVHGGNDYLIADFREEIDNYISPYLRRLYETKYLTRQETTEFANVISGYLIDLMNLIKEYDKPLTNED